MTIAWVLLLFLSTAQTDPVAAWGRFEKAVRDQALPKEAARTQFPELYKLLKDACLRHPFALRSAWFFPVQGCGIRDLGAGGFKPHIRYGSSPVKGYDFYDGNRHGGHPAYDIFIRDRDQDSLNDRNRKPVAVVAPVDLLILSAEAEWTAGSEIRGGRYVWALDPLADRIFYFAHLDAVFAKPGNFCRAGCALGTVGRTGKNAAPARSPTHLHFMVLDVKGNALIPLDYRSLLNKK